MKNIQHYVDVIHSMAKEKGWWDSPRHPLELHMLIVSEIAEASESVRRREPALWFEPEAEKQKPQGELIELADAVIRIMDYCGERGWDLEGAIQKKIEYNAGRPYRHGGKTS